MLFLSIYIVFIYLIVHVYSNTFVKATCITLNEIIIVNIHVHVHSSSH